MAAQMSNGEGSSSGSRSNNNSSNHSQSRTDDASSSRTAEIPTAPARTRETLQPDRAARLSSPDRARTLADAMRGSALQLPPVVVLDGSPNDYLDPDHERQMLDPNEDLWLSTADGRYNSPIIPLHVGTHLDTPHETFYVHRDVLMRSKYFRKALDSGFQESEHQAMNFPEENPSVFHFLIAFLYEQRYVPIRAMACALEAPETDKGKGKEPERKGVNRGSDTDSAADSGGSHSAAARQDRHLSRLRRLNQQKRPGAHRPGCRCPQCLGLSTVCHHCHMPTSTAPPNMGYGRRQGENAAWEQARRRRNMPGAIPPPYQRNLPLPGVVPGGRFIGGREGREYREGREGREGRDRREGRGAGRVEVVTLQERSVVDPWAGDRIRHIEDRRSWLMTYELNLDVYICAERFLMDDFKEEVARASVDMLEMAGTEAAMPEVLRLCRKLYDALSEQDSLLRMVFARVGFLQPVLWQQTPDETNAFLTDNPQVSALILREMAVRREKDRGVSSLPSMEQEERAPTTGPRAMELEDLLTMEQMQMGM